MPTYGGTPILTTAQAEDAFAAVKAQLARRSKGDAERAILQEPGVQCQGWCVTLEASDAFEFWPGWINDTIGDELEGAGVRAHPVSHCHLALYPA